MLWISGPHPRLSDTRKKFHFHRIVTILQRTVWIMANSNVKATKLSLKTLPRVTCIWPVDFWALHKRKNFKCHQRPPPRCSKRLSSELFVSLKTKKGAQKCSCLAYFKSPSSQPFNCQIVVRLVGVGVMENVLSLFVALVSFVSYFLIKLPQFQKEI